MSENRHPLWGVDTSNWTRKHHIKAWAIYVPYAAFVIFMGWLLLSWLRSLGGA